MSAVTDLMPTKEQANLYEKNSISEKLEKRDMSDQNETVIFDATELQEMAKEALKIQRRPEKPLFKRLFSCLVPKAERRAFMQNYEEFESKLDISNIVGDQMSLARLAYVLLSKD